MFPITTVEFYLQVYEIIKHIPKGSVATYGQIAHMLDKPRHSRMVGRALSHGPGHNLVPCHRVVNSQGRLVPGWEDQKALLLAEGVTFKANGCVDLKKCIWKSIN